MILGVAADHAGYRLKEFIKAELDRLGHQPRDFGADGEEACDYPDFAFPLARAVAAGEVELAIWVCGTGVGGVLTAARVEGVRPVGCSDPVTARFSRTHNNANFLGLGQRIIGPQMALEIVRVWLQSEFTGEERHVRRLGKIAAGS